MTDNIPQNQDLSFSAVIFTACICALFGANAVAIKISLVGIGVFTTAGLRFGIASVVIALWARITGRSFNIRKGQVHQLLIFPLFLPYSCPCSILELAKPMLPGQFCWSIFNHFLHFFWHTFSYPVIR